MLDWYSIVGSISADFLVLAIRFCAFSLIGVIEGGAKLLFGTPSTDTWKFQPYPQRYSTRGKLKYVEVSFYACFLSTFSSRFARLSSSSTPPTLGFSLCLCRFTERRIETCCPLVVAVGGRETNQTSVVEKHDVFPLRTGRGVQGRDRCASDAEERKQVCVHAYRRRSHFCWQLGY